VYYKLVLFFFSVFSVFPWLKVFLGFTHFEPNPCAWEIGAELIVQVWRRM